jgi:Tol biopolymer transport system component
VIAVTHRVLALALALSGPACLGGALVGSEIPASPIAFLYRTPEEGRRRAELLEESDRAPRRAGVMQIDGLESWLQSDRDRGAELREFAGRLALLDPQTGEIRTFGAVPRGAAPLSWSNERTTLLFASSRHGPTQLFELDVRTEEIRALTRGPAIHPSGCFGSDGLFAYTEAIQTRDGLRVRIHGRDSIAAPPRALTPGPLDRNPTCQPDGRAIIYVSTGASRRDQLMRVSLDGGAPQRLGSGRDPSYTPDGHWVVYSAQIGGRWQLWRMRPDGTAKTALGRGVADEFWPSVSPDGQYVVYEAEELGRETLFIRRFDGSKQRVLLSKGDGAHPVWLSNANLQWSMQ